MHAVLIALVLAVQAFVPVLAPGDAVPAVPLVDQDDRAFRLGALRGNVVVLSFLYTGCADARACPLVAAKLARIQRSLQGEPIRLVALTLNPRYDTPPVLRAYGAHYGQDPARWTLATGAPGDVATLAARFGIGVQRANATTLVHDEAAVVLGRDGRVATIVRGNVWQADAILARARSEAHLPIAPWAAARLWLADAAEACGAGTLPVSTAGVLALLLAFTALIGIVVTRVFRSPT